MGLAQHLSGKTEASHVEEMSSEYRVPTGEYLNGLDTIELTPTGKFAWLVSITAGVGGLLFGNCVSGASVVWHCTYRVPLGYDTGIISAVLVYLYSDLSRELSSKEKELVTSITSGGAFVGAIIAGVSADRFGRKVAIYSGCFLFIIGAVLQATAFSLAQMAVGRLVVGLGVGSAAMIVPASTTTVSNTAVQITDHQVSCILPK